MSVKLAAGIPHWKLLPYRLPLIFLTAFYDKFPAEDSRIDRLIAKWIWRGALTGDHENVSDGRVDRLVKQLRESSTSSAAVTAILPASEELFDMASVPNSPMRELDQKISLNRASGKIFILALLAANPRRTCGPAQQTLWEIDAEDESSAESPLEPARIYWSLTEADEGNLGTDTIIKIPEMKRKDIFSADPETLHSFLLSGEAIAHLKNGSIDKFRASRRAILGKRFAEFVADRVGDRVDLRPTIEAIVKTRI